MRNGGRHALTGTHGSDDVLTAQGGRADGARTASDVARAVEAGGVETVRVLFADQHGVLRGKTVVAAALASVFRTGLRVPSTLLLKDTSHRTVFPVWDGATGGPGGLIGAGDVLLVPDPATFRILPWALHSAWLFCDVRDISGEPLAFAPRDLLRRAIARLEETGKALVVGLEVEFQVFEVTDPNLLHADAAMPGRPPATRNIAPGHQFLTETLYDRLEPVMDELRRHCQAMGLPVRSMEVEMGPGQFEFTFDPADPLAHADNMMMFRTIAKEVCARRGLHATFMCCPALENAAASGWHLHQSLIDRASGANLMMPTEPGVLTGASSSWIAGLLDHASASCLLTTPTVNGYKRYRPHQLAPDRIQWGRDNRGAMVRAIMAPGDPASRVENRVAETAANPYYFFASQILSGLNGLERGLDAPAASTSPYGSDALALPDSLLAAIGHFDRSTFYRGALGDAFVDYLCRLKRAEWTRYHATVSAWEQSEYFDLY